MEVTKREAQNFIIYGNSAINTNFLMDNTKF